MRRIFALSALAVLASLSMPAAAQNFQEDEVAYRAILNKDWATAERQLQVGLVKNPDNVFRMLNLAWVYAQTGRKAEAAQLYRQVIDTDRDQLAALPSRQGASAKALAEAGLARLAAAP
jgi:hypothetical protein